MDLTWTEEPSKWISSFAKNVKIYSNQQHYYGNDHQEEERFQ